MANPEENADVEILDDPVPARPTSPKRGASPIPSTGSPHPSAGVSPQTQHAMGMVAGVFGLSGFVAVCVVGLAAGLPGEKVLLRAIGALFFCWFVGFLLSRAMMVVISERLSLHFDTHPRPVRPPELDTPADRARRGKQAA